MHIIIGLITTKLQPRKIFIHTRMCLIAFAYHIHPDYPLIVVANRDEFYARPTRSAHFWEDHPDVFAGRDLESPDLAKQGTWMGINKKKRFAAVTNFREKDAGETIAKQSRGDLTAQFLCSAIPMADYATKALHDGEHYKGFNLLLWESNQLLYLSNRLEGIQQLQPGIYGLSNGALDSPWPKVKQAKQKLASSLAQSFSPDSLIALLSQHQTAPDHELPDTGIDIESERLLSACFIRSEYYGTRSTTALLIHKGGGMTFLEQNWNGSPLNEQPVAERKNFLALP